MALCLSWLHDKPGGFSQHLLPFIYSLNIFQKPGFVHVQYNLGTRATKAAEKNPYPQLSACRGPAAPKTSCQKRNSQKLFSKLCAMLLSTLPLSWGHTKTFRQGQMNWRYLGRDPWHGELRGRAAEGEQGVGRREESRERDVIFHPPLQTHMGMAAPDTARDPWALWIEAPKFSSTPRINLHQVQNLRREDTRLD